MGPSLLTAYWIVPPSRQGPLGFGVTTWSLDDAVQIIRAFGYERFLPNEISTLLVKEGVTVADLDQRHVVVNMGPISVCGMWYPFTAVGLPAWVDEKIRGVRNDS